MSPIANCLIHQDLHPILVCSFELHLPIIKKSAFVALSDFARSSRFLQCPLLLPLLIFFLFFCFSFFLILLPLLLLLLLFCMLEPQPRFLVSNAAAPYYLTSLTPAFALPSQIPHCPPLASLVVLLLLLCLLLCNCLFLFLWRKPPKFVVVVVIVIRCRYRCRYRCTRCSLFNYLVASTSPPWLVNTSTYRLMHADFIKNFLCPCQKTPSPKGPWVLGVHPWVPMRPHGAHAGGLRNYGTHGVHGTHGPHVLSMKICGFIEPPVGLLRPQRPPGGILGGLSSSSCVSARELMGPMGPMRPMGARGAIGRTRTPSSLLTCGLKV